VIGVAALDNTVGGCLITLANRMAIRHSIPLAEIKLYVDDEADENRDIVVAAKLFALKARHPKWN